MKRKKALKALVDVMGLGLVGAVATLIGDALWLYHDLSENGFFPIYIGIGGFIFSGLIMSIIALYMHVKKSILEL